MLIHRDVPEESLNDGTYPASSLPQPGSPVTWQMVFWALLSLSLNSMAQPSRQVKDRPSASQFYIFSSPLIRLAEGMSMLVRLTATSTYLRISPRKASQIAILSRLTQTKEYGEHPVKQDNAQNYTWPRWLFFIMGTLPAAIKLASFSGTPWSKAWGMMFIASFVVREAVTLMSRTSDAENQSSVPAILGFSTIEWQDPRQAILRSKTALLLRGIGICDQTLLTVAFFTHVGLVVWTIGKLWLPVIDAAMKLEVVSRILDIYILSLSALFLLLVIVLLVTKRFGLQSARRVVGRVLLWIFGAIVTLPLLPERRSKSTPREGSSWDYSRPPTWLGDGVFIWAYILATYYLCGLGLTKVFRRWPAIGKALALTPRDEVSENGAQESDLGHKVRREEDDGLFAFSFFFTNLVVSLLWYAFKYDSTGTVNPPWTQVFG